MTAAEALKELAELMGSEPTLQVATISRGVKKDDPPELRNLNLADDAKQRFQTIINERVRTKLEPLGWAIRKFDPIYKPEDGGVELEWIRLSEVPAVAQANDRLDNLGTGLAPFDGSDNAYIRRLAYWGALMTSGNRRAYFFRRFSASAELRRKKTAAMVLKGGTFRLVEDRIFLFDEEIDCFVYGDFIFVLRKRDYRRIFDQMQAVFDKAKGAAADLNGKLPIANFSDFEAACCSDSRLADKMIAVRGRAYFDQLSYEMVKPVIDEFELDIPTTDGEDGQVEFEFRSAPAHRFGILRLVDDDYLRSTMTELRYEVNSKTDRD